MAEQARGGRLRGRRAGTGAGRRVARVGEMLAGLITLIAGLIALLIVVGIAFVVLKANPHNSIVVDVHDAAKSLVGPFDGLFKPKNPKLAIGIDWGIAAILYVIVGRLLARVVRVLDRVG
ncbi:MAG: hypothetical protein NVSMB25_09360 [Thermoleophilaceae bacterium]